MASSSSALTSTTPPATAKTILLLGPYPYHVWIEESHRKVLLTTVKHKGELGSSVIRQHYTEVQTFEPYEGSAELEFQAWQLHQKYHFDHVLALAEADLVRAARIRQALGLKGQSVQSALQFRDKILMKDMLQSQKLLTPTYARVESAIDIVSFLSQHGYPAVCKPIRGFGSMGVHILRTPDDVKTLLGTNLGQVAVDGPIDLEIESFVDGQMYHVDGMVIDGTLRLVWPSRYVNTVCAYHANRFIGGVSLPPKHPLTRRIQLFVKECLEALTDAPPSYPFHCEIWHTKDDRLVFCEIAGRAGGGGIQEQILMLFRVFMNRTFSQVQCGDKITGPLEEGWEERVPAYPSLGWMFIYPREHSTLIDTARSCPLPGVVSYEVLSNSGTVFHERGHCADAVASILVEAKDDIQCEKRIWAIDEWWYKSCIYAPNTATPTESESVSSTSVSTASPSSSSSSSPSSSSSSSSSCSSMSLSSSSSCSSAPCTSSSVLSPTPRAAPAVSTSISIPPTTRASPAPYVGHSLLAERIAQLRLHTAATTSAASSSSSSTSSS